MTRITRQRLRFRLAGTGKKKDHDDVALKEMEYKRLSRTLRTVHNDRRRYSQEVTSVLRKQGHEIKLLARDNRRMRTTLSVAYGNYHTKKDINNTLHLKNLLDARGDYRQLVSAEMTMCRDLDLKIDSCQKELASLRKQMGGEIGEREQAINVKRYLTRLENTVNKLTKVFCSKLHNNKQMKEDIVLLVKEKKVYENLYNKFTAKISFYKFKIMSVTQAASSHYEQRLEAMTKMKTLKERSSKDESLFHAEMKVLQRMIAHDKKTKDFMDMKENERLRYKAQEAEKRARMSFKERTLYGESQHVQKYEDLFDSVKLVTGHDDLDHVVNEFTAKDDENFARFDYVSELSHDVEKLRDDIQHIKDNIKRLKEEDSNMSTGCERTIAELKKVKSQLERELKAEVERLTAIDEKLEVICSTIYTLFRTISCSTETSMIGLGFEDKVTPGNLTTCLGLIEQRFLELICILRFVGLHTDHNGNLLKTPRSIHRIRPKGTSKIFLMAVEKPMTPSVNAPSIDDASANGLAADDCSGPIDIEVLRDMATKRITKKEAVGLFSQPLFSDDKRKSRVKRK